MKRFLLTLLGVAALCGLSPHPAAAQTDHSAKTFTITINDNAYNNGYIWAGKRVKAAQPNINDAENKSDLTIDETDPVIQLSASPSNAYGFGQIQFKQAKNEDILTLDFDFSKCSKDGSSPVKNTNQLSSLQMNFGPKTSTTPSAAMRLSMGENKTIKKVVITFDPNKAGLVAIGKNASFDEYVASVRSLGSSDKSSTFICTPDLGSTSGDYRYINGVTYEASGLYGSSEPLCLQMLKSTDFGVLVIRKIEVTYYDNSDGWMPKYDNSISFGKPYGDKIYYRESATNEFTGEWNEATTLFESGKGFVQTRIGKAITTFIPPTKPKTNQKTVIIDPDKYIIGTTIGVQFHTTIENAADDNLYYGISYFIDNHTGNENMQSSARMALTRPTGASAADGTMITRYINAQGVTPENSSITVSTSPNNNPWSVSSATTNQKNGTEVVAGFDIVTLSYTSNSESANQTPMTPIDVIPSGAIKSPATGIYNLLAEEIDVEATTNSACIYPDAKIYYIIGNQALDNDSFDKSKATLLPEGGKIHIDHDCVLSIRTYAQHENTERASNVINRQFKRVETLNVTNTNQLLDKTYKGKTVRLDFPLQILASGYLTASPKELNIYTRDTLGTAVRIVTRISENITSSTAATRLFPGNAFKGIAAQTIATWPFCPAGGVVGTLQFDEQDRPVIVLKDEDNNIDNFEYCYTGASIYPSAAIKQNASVFVRETFVGNRRNKLSADDYGKYVYVVATYNTTDQTFTPVGTTETIPTRISTNTGFLNCNPGSTYSPAATTSLTDNVEYALTGIVEYDSDKQEYYIMPRAINQMPARPKVTTESIANFTQVIDSQEEEDGTAGSATIKLVTKMKLNFTNATASSQYYYFSYFNLITNTFSTDAVTYAAGNKTINLTSANFDENKQIVFTACVQGSSSSNAPFYVSDPYTFTVSDVISKAPVFNSIAEVKKELSGKTANELKDKYYKVASKMVVLGFDDTNKYMYLRDAESDGYIVAYSKKGWDYTDYRFVHGSFHDGTTSRSIYNNPRIGDQITEVTFTPKDESGVAIADVSGLEGKFVPGNIYTVGYQYGYIKGHSYSGVDKNNDPDKTIWGDLEYAEPMYKNHMERLGAPIRKDLCYDASNEADAAKLTFDDSNIADYVAINNVKLTANEDTDPVFSTTGLGTNLEIDWSLLPAAESTAALAEDGDETEEPAVKDVKAEIIKAYNDAKTEGKDIYFNIQGHIFKNATATGYALKIKDYSITEAAPLPTVKVTAAGNEIVATPDADDASKLAASFIKTVSVSSPDAELEDADFEILMSINGGEYEAYDAAKLAGFDTHNTTVAFKCPLRPGYLAGDRITTLTLSKDASDVNTLAEMAGGDNANNLYHFRKHLKVVAAAEGTVMAADKEGNLAVVAAAPAEAEEGKYLADIVLVRNSKNTASIHEIDADAELLDEDESFAISTPAPATLFGVTVAEGNATDAEGNIYTIDPTFAAIPEGDAEAWKLTGYVLADDNDKPVIYLTASQAIDRVALPVITPAEAAFLDKTTVSITCDTEGAAIEYSLDGGKTWNPYTGAFDATASGEILARATADDMLPSHEAKASVVREYLSGDVTITVDEQEALTVITITGPAGAAIYYSLDGTAEKLYNGPLTLTNDTQAVINGQIKAYALESGKRPGAEAVKDYKVSFKPEVTGIDGVGADQEAGSVRVEGNSIIVPEGAQTFDIAGRRVNPQGLPRGIYIVRLASGKAVKAVVK